MYSITAIIPTCLDPARHHTLQRAIKSLREQRDVRASILIVANGPRVDEVACRALSEAPDIRLIRRRPADLHAARLAGREAVETPFFCFLDDDDEYLPDALSRRLAPMLANPGIDVVAGRGERWDRGVKTLSGRRERGDPLEELLTHNWLTACGALYRTRSIGRAFFADMSDYFEWTYLAWRLCLSRCVAFVPDIGHIIHDTPGSLSKSGDYALAHSAVLERILSLPLPARLRGKLRAQRSRALHDLADAQLARGALPAAWRAHVQSLHHPMGLRFLPFTRKLLGASVRRLRAQAA